MNDVVDKLVSFLEGNESLEYSGRRLDVTVAVDNALGFIRFDGHSLQSELYGLAGHDETSWYHAFQDLLEQNPRLGELLVLTEHGFAWADGVSDANRAKLRGYVASRDKGRIRGDLR